MNRRDLDLLSAYLDGELKPADSSKLESRLKTDDELASVLNDLRFTRSLLRRLPSRKAPRNFTLTRKMVGQNPPLPRAYPFFRLATAVATMLFFFTYAVNALAPQFNAPAQFGMGGGNGGDQTEMFSAESPVEESADAAPLAPQATSGVEEPSVAVAPPETEATPAEDATRIQETPFAKDGVDAGQVPAAPDESLTPSPVISTRWQVGLLVIAGIGLMFMVLMRRMSVRRWK